MAFVRLFVVIVAIPSALFAVVGCGPGGPPLSDDVTGTLTKGGKPVMNAQVEFYPVVDGATSYGQTDAEGNFKLYYSTGIPGAVIGKHNVTIIGGSVKAGDSDELKTEGGDDAEEGTLAPVGGPGKTSSGGPKESKGLAAEVVEGPNVIKLEMESDK